MKQLKAKELFKRFNKADFNDKKYMAKLIKQYPEICPITGLRRCNSYWFECGIVYVTKPAYYAYTLPEYCLDDMTFNSIKIDLDDDFIQENICLCELHEILNDKSFEQIKEFYEIPESDIKKAQKLLESKKEGEL